MNAGVAPASFDFELQNRFFLRKSFFFEKDP